MTHSRNRFGGFGPHDEAIHLVRRGHSGDMTAAHELRGGLLTLAKRSVGIMSACSNVESTKLYLVMPFIGLLGYDHANPYEVYPDHLANPALGSGLSIDLAVLRDGAPVIAVSCVKAGADLVDHRSALAAYFDAVSETKLGILTNGVLFEFFVDAVRPGLMDPDPFLTVDLDTISRAGVNDEIVETLVSATKSGFDPEIIAEAAHIQLVRKRLRTMFIEEAKAPSENFCRFALERIGVTDVPKSIIDRYYVPIIAAAYEESLVLPVVERLRTQGTFESHGSSVSLHSLSQRIETSERELSVFAYVRRRLAYLAESDEQFEAIANVRYTDYVGRLVIYYDRERKGRLFDFIEGSDGYDKYVFPEPIGEIVTNDIRKIDTALKTVFGARVRELGALTGQSQPQASKSA